MRFGAQIARASAVPAQNQPVFMKRRAGVASVPMAMPARKKTIVYLVINPMPTVAPMASHQRGFSEVSRRMTK